MDYGETVENPVLHNIDEWIEDNKKFFLPPVCNKMMHQEGQMKLFCVGGPNQRKDYHIEEGEELFYMIKGDMNLKIVEHGVHKDMPIKEGEIFLLPGRIAHSPQRQANTVGLVIERYRLKKELDGLRYFVELDGKPTMDSLYEEWFYCTDLGTELGPIIKKFFASEQYKTGKPLPDTIPDNPPITLDSKRALRRPFPLQKWIDENSAEIQKKGHKQIFDADFQFQVFIYGKGDSTDQSDVAETWIWQLKGESVVEIKDKKYELKDQDTLLIPRGAKYSFSRSEGCVALLCYQDPTKAPST